MKASSYSTETSHDSPLAPDGNIQLISKRLLGLSMVIFLIYYRSPSLFSEPRFWAEEGYMYFAFAFSHSIIESLISPHYGYFNLIPNLGGVLATFAPLEFAPLVTTCLAALIQLLVSSYVIFCDSPYWDTYPKKIAVACLVQLLCPFECWLTTISSQYFLSIAAFFILIETDMTRNSWIKWSSRAILSISVLTSPAVTFLLPAFVFKSWKTRSREDWLQVAIISFGAFVQVIAFVYTCLNAIDQVGGRFNSAGVRLPHIIFVHLSESMFGAYYLWRFNYFGIGAEAMTIILIAFELYFSYLVIKSFFYKPLQLHGIAFILLTVPAILLSIGMYSSPRAAFAPAIILTVLMVYEFGDIRNRSFLRGVALCALSAVMLFGLLIHDLKIYEDDAPPVWKNEVMLWRGDNNYLLRIWPQYYNYKLWKIRLDSKKE